MVGLIALGLRGFFHIARNAITRTQRLLVTFYFSPWIVLYEQNNFSFVETKPK